MKSKKIKYTYGKAPPATCKAELCTRITALELYFSDEDKSQKQFVWLTIKALKTNTQI